MQAGASRQHTGAIVGVPAKGQWKPDRIAQSIRAQRQESASPEIEIEQTIRALSECGVGVPARSGEVDDGGDEFGVHVAQGQ